jgi:hypothetical protein
LDIFWNFVRTWSPDGISFGLHVGALGDTGPRRHLEGTTWDIGISALSSEESFLINTRRALVDLSGYLIFFMFAQSRILAV